MVAGAQSDASVALRPVQNSQVAGACGDAGRDERTSRTEKQLREDVIRGAAEETGTYGEAG